MAAICASPSLDGAMTKASTPGARPLRRSWRSGTSESMTTTLRGGSLLELVMNPTCATGSTGVIGRAYSSSDFLFGLPDAPSHQNADRAPSLNEYQTPEAVTINRILTL